MLTQAVGSHWHALVRDVIALGKDPDDMFVTRDLSFAKMVSIVVASPPVSSLRYFIDGGWSRTDHLIANMTEQRAGHLDMQEPYQRPGAMPMPQTPQVPSKFFPADVITWEEAERRDEERYAKAGPTPPNRSHTRIWGPGKKGV